MRPVEKSVRFGSAGSPLEINPWTDAKPDLVEELGGFCSYCEKCNTRSSFAVEHIFGKDCKDAAGNLIYDDLKYRWDNFLLGCVNCNSVKGDQDITLLNPYMPHGHNLLHYIEVITGGLVQIKAGVAGIDRIRTQTFIDLVGLDRVPGHPRYSTKDDRWDNRLRAYDIAERQLEKYNRPHPVTDIETIVDLARTTGYFAVWYNLFKGIDEVINALLNGIIVNGVLIMPFPGTHTPSFDANNHYETLPRP